MRRVAIAILLVLRRCGGRLDGLIRSEVPCHGQRTEEDRE